MKDEEIVNLFWTRNEDAIEETSKKFGRYLTQIAYNILSDLQDSEECVNDAYLKTWNSIPHNRPTALSCFLGKITRSLAVDLYRKNMHRRDMPLNLHCLCLNWVIPFPMEEHRKRNCMRMRFMMQSTPFCIS